MTRILVLGGTTEASRLAQALSEARVDAVFSYAGRTDAPVAQPLPTRIGGFGGVRGLTAYLRAEAITHVIDATHPFARQMSENAILACAETQIPLLSLERAPWSATPEDDWTRVSSIEEAVVQLGEGGRVFLAIGKQTLHPFAAKRNHYLLRLVDPPDALPLPDCAAVIARGRQFLDSAFPLAGGASWVDLAGRDGITLADPAQYIGETEKGEEVIHFLISHPTPPIFANAARHTVKHNRAEIAAHVDLDRFDDSAEDELFQVGGIDHFRFVDFFPSGGRFEDFEFIFHAGFAGFLLDDGEAFGEASLHVCGRARLVLGEPGEHDVPQRFVGVPVE